MVRNGVPVRYYPDHSLRFSLLLVVTPVTNQESGKPVDTMSDGTEIRKNDGNEKDIREMLFDIICNVDWGIPSGVDL